MSGLHRIADELAALGEQLDEIAFDQLREAVADRALERPASDKRLMQARRAVEKAAHLLRSMDQGL